MFRALYRQLARLFNWVNRTGVESDASRAIKEAERHRQDVESRSGGSSYWGP